MIRILIIFFFIFSKLVFSQCEYTLDSYTHNDCYGDNEGAINITVSNSNSVVEWQGPDGFVSSSFDLSCLYAGTYYITITNPIQGCVLFDSINIEESIRLTADFDLTGRCNDQDSVNVTTLLWGGTPPYSSVWSNGDIGPNANNLPPTGSAPHILTITDANSCIDTAQLLLKPINAMNPFMSSVRVICKDDNSGEARVLIEGGTPPFTFNWGSEGVFYDQQNNFSSITGLYPDIYKVEVLDDMGCIIIDSIEVQTDPNFCINVYKAFSPNDDDVNEFWVIDNIHLYPKAVVSIYDRNGTQVFRRRNYVNSEGQAFGGKDTNGQPLPSATYYYIIDLYNGDDVFKGTLTIVR